MIGAVIYTRVSTAGQVDGTSLDAQARICRDYCHRMGYKILRVFVEEGCSAKSADRPEFSRMFEYCEAKQHEIKRVVVSDVSRFMRHTHAFLDACQKLMKIDIVLESATEPIDDTPQGKLMASMLAGWAQYDNDLRSQKTRSGMLESAKKGRWVYRPPLGYLRGNGDGEPSLILDDRSARLVRTSFQLVADGESKQDALSKVDALGLRSKHGKRLSAQSFSKMLANPIYKGTLRIPKWNFCTDGDWDPIVEEELFERVQAKRRRPEKQKRKRDHPDYPLRRFIRCGACGTPLTGSQSKGLKYYHCRNSRCNRRVCIRTEQLETKFDSVLDGLAVPPEICALHRALVADALREREKSNTSQRAIFKRRLDAIDAKENRLTDEYLNGRIEQALFDRQVERLKSERTSAQRVLGALRGPVVADLEATLRLGESLLVNPRRFRRQLGPTERVALQRAIYPRGLAFDREFIQTEDTSIIFRGLPPKRPPPSKDGVPKGIQNKPQNQKLKAPESQMTLKK